MLTNSCVKLQTVHSVPLTINKDDDDSSGLYGFLNVIVHSATGLKQSSNLYCTLEVDSFGYFVNKAKTRVYRDTTEPNWNEEFEIELEGSQTLRLLCYSKVKQCRDDGDNMDRIMAKGQIQVSKWNARTGLSTLLVAQQPHWCVIIAVGGDSVLNPSTPSVHPLSMGKKDLRQTCEGHDGMVKAERTKLEGQKEELNSSCSAEEEEDDEEVDAGLRRNHSTGARLWGRVRNTLLRQKLDSQSLQGKDWQRTVISMNGIEVKLSMRFSSREFSLKRMPSRKHSGVFGVKIGAVTKREHSKVPLIVRQCVEEIERRGMEEVGIYRVSGVATDIQALKASFDANNKDVSVIMSEMDVNAIAGTLKLYFRELPEPLFTDELYTNFTEGIVAENEGINKMSFHNLATVFGPTLLRPSEKDSKIPANPTQPISMSDSWSLEVMSQVQVLLYFLQLEAIPTPDSKRQSMLFSTEV
ncbi:hypothetical protein DNTS_030443 [Danionella cerebrum]|uniref:Rho-GAP domain-containing protein n=1 Tax=Danionella cerebrum TaxID=2873325 RepID=A0A553RJ55_9TELE|nr:hypothetical protein DNTS_030443 [Danionella translucida]